MAEHRPYRVSGSAAPQLGQVKRLALLSLACTFIAINWITTQHAAEVLHHAVWLGQPFRVPWIGTVYAPWSWVGWWIQWYDVPALTPLWTSSAHEALVPMAAITGLVTGSIALARQGWFANISDLHGSARWATTRDLKAARLIHRSWRGFPFTQDRRRFASGSAGSTTGRRVLGGLAAVRTGLPYTRLRPGACPGFCPHPQREGRRCGRSDAADVAAFGIDSRPQGRELGVDLRGTQSDGPNLPEVRPGIRGQRQRQV
jgi:hypothetical protein